MVDVQNVVDPDVVVNQLEADNMPPNTACREDCIERKALKVEDLCHLMIIDEMERRDQLDFDPSIMWVDDESDDEVDEEEQFLFNILVDNVTLSLKQIAAMDGPESWELPGFIIDSTESITGGCIR